MWRLRVNIGCHDFSLINERCPTLEFIHPFDASILHPRNFTTYVLTTLPLTYFYWFIECNFLMLMVVSSSRKFPSIKFTVMRGFSILFSWSLDFFVTLLKHAMAMIDSSRFTARLFLGWKLFFLGIKKLKRCSWCLASHVTAAKCANLYSFCAL